MLEKAKQICVLVFVAAAAVFGAGCSFDSEVNNTALSVVSTKTYELGSEVSLQPEEFLESVPEGVDTDDIEIESTLKTDPAYSVNGFKNTVTAADKSYLPAGTYSISLKYNGKNYPVTLIVKDTTIPEFISPAAVVTIQQGDSDFDFSSVYRIKDLDEVTLHVEGEYDVSKVGTYPVTLIAQDASGNTNSLEITINVVTGNQVFSSTNQFEDEQPVSSSGTENEAKEEENTSDESTDSENKEETPDSSGSTACSVSNVPENSKTYKTFEEAYQAGTEWNQQDGAHHYFYYIISVDDCGDEVYIVTFGTGSLNDALPQLQSSE
jgi:hypothetical protein